MLVKVLRGGSGKWQAQIAEDVICFGHIPKRAPFEEVVARQINRQLQGRGSNAVFPDLRGGHIYEVEIFDLEQKLESFRQIRQEYFRRKEEAKAKQAEAECQRKADREARLARRQAEAEKKKATLRQKNIIILQKKYGYTKEEAEERVDLTIWDDGYNLTVEEWLRYKRSQS